MEPANVTHVPKPLSPTYRSRVPKLSGTNRSPNVHHEPKHHNPLVGASELAGEPVRRLVSARLPGDGRASGACGVGPVGIEPTTNGLKARCSAN